MLQLYSESYLLTDTEGAVNLDGGLYDWHSRNGGNVINLKKTIVPSLPDIGMGKGLRNASDGYVIVKTIFSVI